MCPPCFTLFKIDPSKNSGLQYELHLKPHILIELCASNYCTNDGIVNGVEGFFKVATKSHSTSKIWIHFLNPIIWQDTRITNQNLHENYPTHQKDWTFIIPKVQEIQIAYNSNHLFTCVQFPIQWVVAQTIPHA